MNRHALFSAWFAALALLSFCNLLAGVLQGELLRQKAVSREGRLVMAHSFAILIMQDELRRQKQVSRGRAVYCLGIRYDAPGMFFLGHVLREYPLRHPIALSKIAAFPEFLCQCAAWASDVMRLHLPP